MQQEETNVVEWISKANLYEVNLRQYSKEGTFKAFQEHIPRLQKMGVKVLWFMPIHPIGLINRKEGLGSYYSIKDFKGINPEFGDLNDFKATIQLAHQNGMKVIIDWVANHTSWDNNWVKEHPEYYAKDVNGAMYAPYDWSDVVQLDHQNKAQQIAMLDAMEYWVTETNIDGFRCDMAHLTPLDFWIKARAQCNKHKQLFWLAETQDEPYFEAFDVIYGWEWLHKMEEYYNGKTDINGLHQIIEKYQNEFEQNKFRILFTSNHDENSWQGTEYKRLGDSAKAFAVLCASLPGMPLIYSGQEEPLLRKLSFFSKDEIGFATFALQDFYQNLLTLKNNNNALNANALTTFYRINTTCNSKVYCYLRKMDTEEVLIIANLSNEKSKFSIQDNKVKGNYSVLNKPTFYNITNELTFDLLPWDVLMLKK